MSHGKDANHGKYVPMMLLHCIVAVGGQACP